MAKLKNYVALIIDQDDAEDSSVILLSAENENAAIKQIIETRLGFDMSDEMERDMAINISNDNPIMLSEVKGTGFTKDGNGVSFDQIFLDEEMLNDIFGELNEEED
jgi:hypothetical protein